MNVLDAAYNAAHDYQGGAEALAVRLGKRGSSLSHELTGTGTAKLGLLDAVKISQLTGDVRVVQAYAAACGGMFVPLAPVDTHGAALQDVAVAVKEFSDLVSAFTSAMADGVVTDNELRRVEREAGDLFGAVHRLLQAAKGLNSGCGGGV